MSSNTSIYKTNFFLPHSKISFSKFPAIFKLENSTLNTTTMSSVDKKAYNLTQNVVWSCKKCGHVHIGANPPSECPICSSDYEKK